MLWQQYTGHRASRLNKAQRSRQVLRWPCILRRGLTYFARASRILRGFVYCIFALLCSAVEAIKKSFSALSGSYPHEAYLAFYYSYQARFDYWLSTNSIAFTDTLAEETDESCTVISVHWLVVTCLLTRDRFCYLR